MTSTPANSSLVVSVRRRNEGRNMRRQEKCITPLSNGRWRVMVRYRCGSKIKNIQTTTDTKDQARNALADLRLKVKSIREGGSFPIRPNAKLTTFGEALDYYLSQHDAGKNLSYIRRLKKDLGKVPIAEIRERFKKYLILLRSERTNSGIMSPGSRNRFLSWGNAALNLCVSDELIEVNPLARIKHERETPRDRALSDLDRLRLLNAVEKHAPYLLPIVTFASLVPTRFGELSNLTPESVDLINNVIRLVNGSTKNRDGRYLPIPDECRSYFESLPHDTPYVFYRQTKDGQYHQIRHIKRSWRKSLKAAGLVGFRFHDLRACAATNLILAGNDTRAVMGVAGWRTDMLRIYYRRDNLTTAKTVRFLPQCDGNVMVSKFQNAENA